MIRLLLAFLCCASPSIANTARVYSGEHGEFTRLVIELPAATDWTLGRVSAGYAFAAPDADRLAYDLSGVWQRISRTRVATLEADAKTGVLTLGLACDCHVFPFEYRAGIVVLDVRPGPPPPESAFEAAFPVPQDDASKLVPAAVEVVEPLYNWLTVPPKSNDMRQRPAFPMPLPTGETSLLPLRDALLMELAAGAAAGTVDMALPPGDEVGDESPQDVLPWTNLRIGELPGILALDPNIASETPVADGPCTNPLLLDVAAWGAEGSPADLLANARTGLFGEFDAVDSDAVLRAVRVHLYLGFGAEARQLGSLAEDTLASDTTALYQSMGHVIDGESDPDTPFSGMLDCDGPAALWAALALDRFPAGPGVNRDAILREFQVLPPNLRSHLGTNLSEKFLALDDLEAARLIRDAMERSAMTEPAAIALLDAQRELQQGDPADARIHAEDAVSLDRASVEALGALVETHFRTLTPISPDIGAELAAFRGETRGTDLEPVVDRAWILALALSGRIDESFQELAGDEPVAVDLWQVVVYLATDDDFLRHAVPEAGRQPPELPDDLTLVIVDRLIELGFPDVALTWQDPGGRGDPGLSAAAKERTPQSDTAVEIRANPAVPDRGLGVDTILSATSSDPIPAPSDTTPSAIPAQPEPVAIPTALSETGDTKAQDPENLVAAVEQYLKPGPQDPAMGLLRRGDASLESSAAARAAIEAMLNSVQTPKEN